tara:strand:- start:12 stop:1157 length:1146 start_codon:yes stop_codon:yes gene_type:complete
MSRTLKRPMFRGGGKVNSEGTGITSGLVDREPYKDGKIVGGGQMSRNQLLSEQPFNLLDYLRSLRPENFTAGGQMSRTTEPSGAGVDLTPSIIPEAGASEIDTTTTETTQNETTKKDDTIDTTEQEKPETTKANQPGGTGLDIEDLDDIKLSDFEEDITRKAEIYEKLLGGKDARTQAGFRALTAGGLKALQEGDVVSGLQEGFEKLEGIDDLSKKAKLLAIQEKIAKDAQKTPTKSSEVDILANRYMANGMSRADAFAAAEQKVYGSEKSELLAAYSPDRELQDLTAAFAKSDDDLIEQNPSGFAQAELYKRQGVKVITYENYYDAEKERSDYRPKIGPADIKSGDVYFDPISFQFFYKNKAGETGSSYSLEEAKTKASG